MIKILPMIQGVINEKKELGGAYIDSIRMLTDRNSHTRARAELARALGDKRLINAYEGLMYVEDLLRDSNDIKKARARLDKMLFAKSKKVYSNHDIIMGVF
tara:strand:+ start:425 stop:727 length:303 start_codon:yes stop_codon:yes gene_type:complete